MGSYAALATLIFTTVLAGILQTVRKKLPGHFSNPRQFMHFIFNAPNRVDVSFLIHTQLDFQWLFQLPSFVLSPTLKLLGFGLEIFFE